MEGAQKRNQEDFRTDLAGHLFKYTAAISRQKIKRRITNKHVSQPYIESLQKVTTVPIPSQSHQNSESTEDVKHDRLLLKFIKAVGHTLRTETPNLLALAKLNSPTFPIYNEKTRMEFHQLLLELLNCFEKAVVDLCNISGLKTKSNDDSSQFTNALAGAHMYGYGLLKIARGQTFRMHMENIAPLLKKPHHTMPVPASNAEDPVEEAKDKELEDTEVEEELSSVLLLNKDKGGTQKTLTKSYVDWLRLTVAHFDAVEIVMQYIMSPNFGYNSIAITNLVAPTTSEALYPWEELITNEKYFPTRDTTDPLSTTSNDEILKFLKAAVDNAAKARKLSALAEAALTKWNKHQTTTFTSQQVCRKMTDIMALGDEHVNEIAKSVDTQLQSWLKGDNGDTITKGIQDLHKKLCYLPPGNHFFSSLENLKFKGVLHCEICLASLVDMANKPIPPGSPYTELLSQLKVIIFSLIHFSPNPYLVCYENSLMDE